MVNQSLWSDYLILCNQKTSLLAGHCSFVQNSINTSPISFVAKKIHVGRSVGQSRGLQWALEEAQNTSLYVGAIV